MRKLVIIFSYIRVHYALLPPPPPPSKPPTHLFLLLFPLLPFFFCFLPSSSSPSPPLSGERAGEAGHCGDRESFALIKALTSSSTLSTGEAGEMGEEGMYPSSWALSLLPLGLFSSFSISVLLAHREEQVIFGFIGVPPGGSGKDRGSKASSWRLAFDRNVVACDGESVFLRDCRVTALRGRGEEGEG